ncbi:hypothetical protein Vafri_19955 [Volvox africanus]|nr:hypothetical protein Vafri_19955 [Volvox africanus]
MGCEVRGFGGSLAGLHTVGTRLVCIKSSGAAIWWDTANMQPCGLSTALAAAAAGGAGDQMYGVGGGLGVDDGDDEMLDCAAGGTDADADMCDMLFEYDDDELAEMRPQQRRRRDMQTCAVATGSATVSAIHGVPPHTIGLLPLPSPFGKPSPAEILRRLARSSDFESSALYGGGAADVGPIQLTRLLNDDAAPTLAAALSGNIIVTYDMETLRVKQRLFGHLYGVTDIAAPPSSWQQPKLFATCACSGDVKIWDMRTSGSSAAVTLTGGETWQLNAVVLASAGGSGSGGDGGGGGGGSSGGPLGAGMVCFAGGEGESIWSWDLRGGHARPMYELSTGNTQVLSLAWHATGSSLWASCKSPWQSSRATYNPQDWKLLQAEDAGAAAGAAAAAAAGGGGGRSDGPTFSAGGATAILATVAAAAPPGGLGGVPTGGAHSSAGGSRCSAGGSSGLGGGGGSSSGAASGFSGAGFFPSHPDTTPSLLSRDGVNPNRRPGDSGVARRRYWPVRAKHQPTDFGAYFNMARSCVLRYRFSEQATRSIAQSWEPQLGSR